ncbi:MAG TPA: thermostable hemolysin [Limnobacter sp.]|nr:thermostable hemolysin [Limnobacter sp.]
MRPLDCPATALMTVQICLPHTPDRPTLERFVKDIFWHHHHAKVEHFYNTLLALRSADGELCGVTGYSLAGTKPMFLEQYLDEPVEALASRVCSQRIERKQIVEVGNMACSTLGGARMLIQQLTAHLHSESHPWVVFTATRTLLNSFKRLGLNPVVLAPARRERVYQPENWGHYYDEQPMVVLGNVQAGAKLLRSKPWTI